jgi:hypothetical protein
MQGDSDAVARGAQVVRLDRAFRWPGGRHLAVVLNVAYEGWSDGKAPGIGPMGNPLPAGAFDTNALSWGSHGAARGIERLLRVLERTKRSASVMVSGVFGERTSQCRRKKGNQSRRGCPNQRSLSVEGLVSLAGQ